ncbi:hypothetical protein [Rhodopila sp.]|jgi:hypothetical protein|uniref:hypothetical protein n=1 Tax=Rhodopila sp. TaxID=2480087 RepID=UPI002B862624|nr:hypothetical protein [Rhodopila sp.]HVZ07552.1 hypothetical protein [Rhodopila sp.]
MSYVVCPNGAKVPALICGRPVWVSESGSDIYEVWVHAAPGSEAVAHVTDNALVDGTPEANLAYLEELVADVVNALPPASPEIVSLWSAHMKGRNGMRGHPES